MECAQIIQLVATVVMAIATGVIAWAAIRQANFTKILSDLQKQIVSLECSRHEVTIFVGLNNESRLSGDGQRVEPVLQVGNLSHVGIWLYSLTAYVTVNEKETKECGQGLNYAIGPFSPHSIDIGGPIRAAIGQVFTEPWPNRINARIEVKLDYWGAGQRRTKTADTESLTYLQGQGIIVGLQIPE